MKLNKVKGSNNITAIRDVNIYHSSAISQENEMGVINDIFKYVIEVTKSNENSFSNQGLSKEKLLHLNDKINLNFNSEAEINEVKEYFTQLFSRISAVEKHFQMLDENDQEDVHFYVSSAYNDLKRTEKDKVIILKRLSEAFIPPSNYKNPTYVSIAQAIVLFFFDDCTIFEKTKKEEIKQINLFENL